MVTPRRTHRHITVHVRVKWHQLKNIFTGQWGPKTKIWLRAMSTRFQASARLSWSGADAFVPGTARERALVTLGLAAGLGGTGRGARSLRWPCVVPGRLRSAAASPLLRSGSSGHSGPTAVGGQRRNPVTLGPSSAGGQEARDCPDTCRARPRGAAPSYGAAGQPALRRRPPLCCCRPHPHAAAKQAGRACPRAAPSGQLTAGRQTRGGKSGRAPRDGAVANSSHREGTSVLAPRESKSAVSRYPWEPVLMPATQAVGTLRHTGPQTHPARP